MANIEVSIFPGGNKGYGAAGASHTKRSVKGFTAQSGSPREDIDSNNGTMRQRCRMLYMSAPVATSGIKTNRTNTIGLGLKLNPKIDWEYLGITTEQAEDWESAKVELDKYISEYPDDGTAQKEREFLETR